jgi:Tfp pilus assembly protein PilN
MIKINLLGDEEQKPINSLLSMVAVGASVVLTLIVLMLYQWYVSSALIDVENRIQITEVQLSSLQQKTKEVDSLKKTKEELESITLAIAILRRSQQGPVRLLDDINQSTPARIWITAIDSKVDRMKITGLAIEDGEISDFIKNLRNSSLIPEAELIDRRAVPLMQVNTFNSFTGDQTKRVVRGDRSQLSGVFNEIKTEAEAQGLTYSYGIPESSLKESIATVGDAATGAVTKLSFDDIKSRAKKSAGGRPTIFAWESLEQVRGLGFTADLKIRYDDSGVDIEALSQTLNATEEVNIVKSKGKK